MLASIVILYILEQQYFYVQTIQMVYLVKMM